MSAFEYGHYENGEPYVKFTASGHELTADYSNSSLFTHGTDKHIDHFFVELGDELAQELDISMDRYRALGAFVWRQAVPDFDELVNFIIEENFNQIHRPYPNEEDRIAYQRSGYEPPVDTRHPSQFKEAKVIEEVGDDEVVQQAMAHIDEELKYYLEEE